MSITNVVLSKEEQIAERREVVLTLKAQGLTASEIHKRLSGISVSRKTIARDLDHIKRQAKVYLKNHEQEKAHEHQLVLSNYYQLRKICWEWFYKEGTDDDTKLSLLHTLEHINADIVNMMSISDMIRREEIEEAKHNMKVVFEEVESLTNRNDQYQSSQAKF